MMQRLLQGSLLLTGLSLLIPMTAVAGEGKFEGKDLSLHVFFAKKRERAELMGNSETDFASSWKDYIRQSAGHYYDAHEGLSRIKKVYFYNGVPEGKAKADVFVDGNNSPAADESGFGKNGRYLDLPEDFKTTAFAAQHYMQTLTHELGHYIYALNDSYGGVIKDANGDLLPQEYLTTKQEGATIRVRNAPATSAEMLNYRSYMWSNEWLRYRLGTVRGQTVAPGLFFYEPSGRLLNGIYPNGSIMSPALRGAPTRDSEFSTPGSHLTPVQITFRMPSYKYLGRFFGTSTRPEDKTSQTYTLETYQHYASGGKSEWEMVSQYLGLPVPTASTSTQTLAEADMPQVILVGGAAIVLCIDRSGSMDVANRIKQAKVGANAAVTQLRLRDIASAENGHHAGVVSFSSSASVDRTLQEIETEESRNGMRSVIDGLSTGGGTSIGGGLRASLNQLLTQPEMTKAIILLTDGEHTQGELPSAVMPDLLANNVKVYTIGLGDSPDIAALNQLSADTRGETRVTEDGSDLEQQFLDLMAKVSGAGATTATDIPLKKGQTYQETTMVEQGAKRVVFMYRSTHAGLQPSLRSPRKKTITPITATPGVRFVNGPVYDSVELTNPEAGNWTFNLANKTSTTGNLGLFKKKEDPPLAITDRATTTSTIPVSVTGIVSGLQVGVDILHTYRGDLEVTLVSPQGTRIRLYQASGGSEDNLKGTFGVNLTSVDPLAPATEVATLGDWKLEVYDRSSGDTGTLKSWSLKFIPAAPVDATATVSITTENNSVTAEARVTPAIVTFPNPVKLTTNVTAYGASIAGASVYADVFTPEGSHFTLPLYDDGLPEHGDDEANDGSYNSLFDSYTRNGSYNFRFEVINKTGRSANDSGLPPEGATATPRPKVPPFERSVTAQCTVSGVPVTQNQQFTLDSFTATDKATFRADSMDIRGTFNAVKTASFDGLKERFSFEIGQDGHDANILSQYWKRVGRTNRYTNKTFGQYAYFNYFIGGSTKCSFVYQQKDTEFFDYLQRPGDLKISLKHEDQFNDDNEWTSSVNVLLDSVGSVRRYKGQHTQPDLFVSTMSFKLSKTRDNADSMTFSARVKGPFSTFDPATGGIKLKVGPFERNLLPGSFTQKKTVLTYRETTPVKGSVIITYDTELQLLRATVTKDNLGLVAAQPLVPVEVELTGFAGASWQRRLGMSVNSSKTSFRY